MKRKFTFKLLFTLLSVIWSFAFVETHAQRVTGTVTDATSSEGLPGVTVTVKGTTRGVMTDESGKFSIEANGPTSVLTFSMIGYVMQEVLVGNQTVVNIKLNADNQNLDDLVVVGYGVQKKETVTGSVATVKGEELVKSPAVNLSNSIAGRMPGVIAVNRSGEPGFDGSSIRIRGSNTLGNNDALIVIDGIPNRAGGLDRINPADIESISVLKDASAAIYGARAANGVILITTKRGKSGKPELSYSFNQGYSQPTVTPKMTSSAQYAEMLNDLNIYALPVGEWSAANQAYKSSGVFTRPNGQQRVAPFSPEAIQKLGDGSDPWNYPNTDWFGATLKNWSPQVRHNLQLNGGGENIKYYTSLGYQDQDAYYKNSATGYSQYDLRLNLDAKINNYINLSVGVLAREEVRRYPTKGAGAIFRMLMRGKPQMPAYWPNGQPGPDIEYGENPVVITTNQTGYDRQKNDFFQTNGQLDIKIPGIDGLKFTGTAALDKRIWNRKLWTIPWTLYERGSGTDANGNPNLVASKRGPAEPNLNQYTENQLNILLGAVLQYDKKFGSHTIGALAGTNRETIEGENMSAYRRFFISPAIDQMFAGGDLEKNNGGGAYESARLNYFGRFTYNFKEKYLAELLWRYDASDIFPADTRYGFFPGAMVGWVVSEENFMKNNVKFLDYLKIRGSWGQMGNDQVSRYQYLATYGFGSYIINGNEYKTLSESRIPNTAITWEIANNANLGIEGAVFDNKLTFEFEFFNNLRTNILTARNASVPQSTGLTLPNENIGKVRNRGWEFNFGWRDKVGDLTYNIGLNGGYAKNRIEFWDEAPGAPDWQRSTGRPMGTFLMYEFDGVFKDQAEIDANPLNYSAVIRTLRPGDMKYKDTNGDGKIDPDDRIRPDFNNTPLFQGGLVLGGQYKNFDLSVLFQAAAGAKQFVSTAESGSIGNFFEDVYQNRWTIDNPSSEHPRIAERGDQYYSFNNTYWFRSRDYIRLKNLEIGYSIPASVLSKIKVSNLRVYFNGLNLITWDKLKILDPESDNQTGQYYPQARVINAGLTVTF
jgi:TonB-linked SusC/RagA family outer membrane protein